MTKVILSEIKGYKHVRSQFENPEKRRVMNQKLGLLTLFFSMMAIENAFRIADFTFSWQFPIDPLRPDDIDFSSDYNILYSEYRRGLLVPRKALGPGALAHCLTALFLWLLNNIIWIRRRNFSAFWHTIHYFLAATLLVLYMPRHDWWKVMMDPKFAYTNMNVFIYQIVLGQISGLTVFHQFTALLLTMTYMVIETKSWYQVNILPIYVWDGYLHMILPTILMLLLGYIGTKERILKDEKMESDFSDIKKVLGNLP